MLPKPVYAAYPYAILKIIRIPNLFILVLTQYFAAIFLTNPLHAWQKVLFDPMLLYLCLSTVLIAAGGYVINDYYDVKIDIINKPSRLVVGRIMARRHAMFFHAFFTLAGLGFAFFAGYRILIVNLGAAMLLWWYSNYLKRLPLVGNITVAVLSGLAIWVVGLLFHEHRNVVITYAVFAFIISLIREIIKDMEDMRGDKNYGCLTFPIKYGIRTTKKLIYILELGFSILIVCIGLYFGINLFMFFLLLVIAPLLIFTFLLVVADARKDFAVLSTFCKWIMLSGILSMVFI